MMDEAAAREIERLTRLVAELNKHCAYLDEMLVETASALEESERQRKALTEHLEALGVEGINAATGAGR